MKNPKGSQQLFVREVTKLTPVTCYLPLENIQSFTKGIAEAMAEQWGEV